MCCASPSSPRLCFRWPPAGVAAAAAAAAAAIVATEVTAATKYLTNSCFLACVVLQVGLSCCCSSNSEPGVGNKGAAATAAANPCRRGVCSVASAAAAATARGNGLLTLSASILRVPSRWSCCRDTAIGSATQPEAAAAADAASSRFGDGHSLSPLLQQFFASPRLAAAAAAEHSNSSGCSMLHQQQQQQQQQLQQRQHHPQQQAPHCRDYSSCK